MEEYVTSSLETHLFFGRIMKEHALFLQAGFPAGETGTVTRLAGIVKSLKKYCGGPFVSLTEWWEKMCCVPERCSRNLR